MSEPAPQPPAPVPPEPAPTPEPTSAPTDRTFSQADVDRIVQERLARAKSAPPSDYEELKAKAAKLDQMEAEQKSDLEKANERIAKLERQAADAAQSAQESLLRAAVVSEAAKRNVVDPDAAIALLDRSTLDFDDEGQPTNVAKAMDSLLEARPYLVVANGGARGNADQGARSAGGVKQVTESELKTMTPEAIDKARKEGRLSDLLGASS